MDHDLRDDAPRDAPVVTTAALARLSFELSVERDAEARFREWLTVRMREDYDRHVIEERELRENVQRSYAATEPREIAEYAGRVQKSFAFVMHERGLWRRMRVRWAERDCSPIVVRTPDATE